MNSALLVSPSSCLNLLCISIIASLSISNGSQFKPGNGLQNSVWIEKPPWEKITQANTQDSGVTARTARAVSGRRAPGRERIPFEIRGATRLKGREAMAVMLPEHRKVFRSKHSKSIRRTISNSVRRRNSKTYWRRVVGSAYAGYLVNCTVFIDENDDGLWNQNEPKTATNDEGTFAFAAATSEGPLVLIADQRCFDKSTGSGLPDHLFAPPLSPVISPLTTLLYYAMVFLSTGQAEAKALIAKSLSLPSDFSSGQGTVWPKDVETDLRQRHLIVVMAQIQILTTLGGALIKRFVKDAFATAMVYKAIAFHIWKLDSRLDFASYESTRDILELARVEAELTALGGIPERSVPDGAIPAEDMVRLTVSAVTIINGHLEALGNETRAAAGELEDLTPLLLQNGYSSGERYRLIFSLGVVARVNWLEIVERMAAGTERNASYVARSMSEAELVLGVDQVLKLNVTSFGTSLVASSVVADERSGNLVILVLVSVAATSLVVFAGYCYWSSKTGSASGSGARIGDAAKFSTDIEETIFHNGAHRNPLSNAPVLDSETTSKTWNSYRTRFLPRGLFASHALSYKVADFQAMNHPFHRPTNKTVELCNSVAPSVGNTKSVHPSPPSKREKHSLNNDTDVGLSKMKRFGYPGRATPSTDKKPFIHDPHGSEKRNGTNEEDQLLERIVTRWLFGESMWKSESDSDSVWNDNNNKKSKCGDENDETIVAELARVSDHGRLEAPFKKRKTSPKENDATETSIIKADAKKIRVETTTVPAAAAAAAAAAVQSTEKENFVDELPSGELWNNKIQINNAGVLETAETSRLPKFRPSLSPPFEEALEDEYAAFRTSLIRRMNLRPWMLRKMEEGIWRERLYEGPDSGKMDRRIVLKEAKKKGRMSFRSISSSGSSVFQSTWP